MRTRLLAVTLLWIALLGSWPVAAGRLAPGWLVLPVLAGLGALGVAGGYPGAVVVAPGILGAQYALSLRAQAGPDGLVVAEAAGLIVLVELLAWCGRARFDASVDAAVTRARTVRLVALAPLAGAIAGCTLLAAGDERRGPQGLGALAIGVLAVIALAALVLVALRPQGRGASERAPGP